MKNLETAANAYPAVALKNLTDDAIEGLFHLSIHTKSPRRLERMLKELIEVGGKSVPEAMSTVNALLRRIKQGQERLDAALPRIPAELRDDVVRGWHGLLALGPGTSTVRRSTQGFNHQIEDMLRKADWSKVRALDRVVPGFPPNRRLDLFEEISELVPGVRSAHSEYKAVLNLSERDIEQLGDYVSYAVRRAGGVGVATADQVLAELPTYVLRGEGADAAAVALQARLRVQLVEAFRKYLPEEFKELAARAAQKARFAGTYPF